MDGWTDRWKKVTYRGGCPTYKILEWFEAIKLSLNEDKTRFTIFHQLQDRDNLPLQLPVLNINNYKIKRLISKKFLGVMIDEHLNWKDHT